MNKKGFAAQLVESDMEQKLAWMKARLQEAEKDIEEGNVDTWDAMMMRVREKNGL